MNGNEAYEDSLKFLTDDARRNTIRLDHALEDLPRLDDVDRLPELAVLPYTISDEVVRAVLAALFFFQA